MQRCGHTALVALSGELPSARIWWVPASIAVGWLMITLTAIPAWVGWTYLAVNIAGTGVAIRLQVARLEEWGDARPDRGAAGSRPLPRP